MGYETATYIDGLVVSNPVGSTDPVSQGDNHIRLLKETIKNSFPNVVKATYLQIAQDSVAAATTTDIGAVASDNVLITGSSVTITGLGTVGAGTYRTVRFADSNTLTHNGTSLILPGGASITTATDDIMGAVSLGSGNWLVLWYTKAAGTAITSAPPTTVRAATTGNITIATALTNGQTLDTDVTLANDDLVLVKDQTSDAENGIYVVGPSPARRVGYDTYDAHPGAHIKVQEGRRNKSSKWQCTSPVGGTLDATALDWILTSTPIGTMQDYAGLDTRVPAGWLLCYGQEISETTYATLFDALSITYNTGGETAGFFRVPDARGRVVAGKDDMGSVSANRLTDPADTIGGIDGDTLGNTGGDEIHLLTALQLPDHTHTYFGSTSTNTGGGAAFTTIQNPGNKQTFQSGGTTIPGNDVHNNVQPTIIMNKIIYAGV